MPGAGKTDADAAVSQDESDADYADEGRQGGNGCGTVESYWNSNDFEYYSETQKERLARALKAEKYHDSNNASRYTVDVKPYAYQQEILDKLEAQREVRGNYRNLIVAATGTGKTVISALDYKRFVKKNSDKKCRLLFVAHRKEILEQSRDHKTYCTQGENDL